MRNIIPFIKEVFSLLLLTFFIIPAMAIVVSLEKVLVDACVKDAVEQGAIR